MIPLPKLEVKTASAAADIEMVPVFQDAGKKPVGPSGPYASLVGKFRKGEGFTGRSAGIQYVPFAGKRGAKNALLVGFGMPADVTEEKARVAGAHALHALHAQKVGTVTVNAASFEAVKGLRNGDRILRAFLEGLMMTAYKFDKYKKQDPKDSGRVGPARVLIVTKGKESKTYFDRAARELTVVTASINLARDWSNEPSNFGTPEYYAAESVRLAKEFGIGCKILSEKDAEREKMGLFISVGIGSEREGKIVVLDYHPKNAKKTIALVGKGITFDSGGISIKPSMRMEEMKHDMSGAATMMGAILAAARTGAPNRVIAVLGFTENMPSGIATQPGNVIRGRNGKTVEVVNTDAEGRLILADLLDYAQDFKPDCVINAATLTGAVVVALGKQCCGIMGNDEALVQRLVAAGDSTHERMWPLPLYDEYFDDLKTDCADMRNVANDGNGGTIRGGIFLKQFVRKGMPWAHLDIAATGWGMGHLAYHPKKGGSGMHVRALLNFIQNY